MTIDPKDQITVSLPVAGVLTAAEIEQGTIAALEKRVIQHSTEAGVLAQRLSNQLDRLETLSESEGFTREGWSEAIQALYNACGVFTRAAVAISTSLAARDALIQQNTTRAPESALEREG